jgi:hypothetical protein
MSYARKSGAGPRRLIVRAAVILMVLSVGTLSSNTATGARRYGPGDTGVVNVSNSPDMAEGEQPLSVNPMNPNQIVVVSNTWQRTWPDPLSDAPGPTGMMMTSIYTSRDGGRTWLSGKLDRGGFGRWSNPLAAAVGVAPEWQDTLNVNSTDAGAAWDRHGNAYYEAGNVHGINHGFDEVATVWRSSDGLRSWGQGVHAVKVSEELMELDRPWLVVDNSGGPRDGTVYVAFSTTPFVEVPPKVYVRSSRDHGATWGPTYRVDHGLYTTQFNPRHRPVVDAAGDLNVVYDEAPPTVTPFFDSVGRVRLVLARSRDGGKTFTNVLVDGAIERVESPDEAIPAYTEMISAIAADPKLPGRIAVAWPQRIGESSSRIMMRYTTNGGRTWTPRIDVSNSPASLAVQHDHVSLAWTQDGRVVASWRDRRCCGGTWDSRYQQWARIFAPAGNTLRAGKTIELTEGPQANNNGHHGLTMPDEFQGLDSSGGYLMASWSQLAGRYTDVVFRRVPLTAFR